MTIDCFSNIAFLPNDMWVAITIKVASDSIRQLCSLRMTCKAARDAGDSDIVHRSVSIPPPHATPWWWCLNPEAKRFFDRCMVAGHPELLFREALRELFIRHNEKVGLQMLNSATSTSHVAAKYALSMTLLLHTDGNDDKEKGLELYRELDAAGSLADCKSRCFSILTVSWPGEVQMPRIEEQHTVCAAPRCSTRGHMPLLYDYRRRAAERNSVHAYGGAAHIPCIQCRADYDLQAFVNLP
ncbi:putative F-box protein At1g67623 [Arachis stenosperma]|uniref:putative F-box protein At1g67623 n=1 Tax=Arachis stenosperma TaxID=217475 RepID=UPI0025ABD313|nr:putative F-box protein At1g67623 [Arachis stenosperma]